MAAGLVIVVVALGAVVVVAAIAGAIAYAASRGRPKPWQAPEEPGTHDVVTLQLQGGEAGDPAVQRLVREAASRRFGLYPHIETVEVRRLDGAVLGRVDRKESLKPPPTIPQQLHVERAHRPHEPKVTESDRTSRSPLEIDPEDFATSDKPFADSFSLPDEVRERITDLDSPTAVVSAILAAANVSHRDEPGMIVAGDVAIVLVGDGTGHTVTGDDLSAGYLKFESAHVRDGVAICLGYVNPQELHRRELLAPALKHAGPEAIQRMADALALGGNPVAFAAGPGSV